MARTSIRGGEIAAIRSEFLKKLKGNHDVLLEVVRKSGNASLRAEARTAKQTGQLDDWIDDVVAPLVEEVFAAGKTLDEVI